VLFPGNLILKHCEQSISVLQPTRVIVDATWGVLAHGAKVLTAIRRSAK
jgi:hypothetical protein